MNTRICLSILLTVSVAGGAALAQNRALAQNKVRTETIRPAAPGEQTIERPARHCAGRDLAVLRLG
jgi:hypothetical protein